MARSGSQERKVSRKRRIGQGVALGALALGVPALANALIARRAAKLPPAPAADLDDWEEQTWASPIGPIRLLRRAPRRSEATTDIPAVFLHSLGPGHSSTQWLDAASEIAQAQPVILMDLPGWGESMRTPLDYGLALTVDLLHTFVAEVINGQFDLVASGESATVALSLAEVSSEVRSLALSGPAGFKIEDQNASVTDKGLNVVLGAPILRTSAVNAYTSRGAIESNLVRHQTSPPSARQIDEHYRIAHLPGSGRALAAFLRGQYERSLENINLREELPVFIAWGRNAVGEPVEDADLWLNQLPQAALAVFEHSASWPHVDQPSDFAGELLAFQTKIDDQQEASFS